MKKIILTSISLVLAALTYYGCGSSSSSSSGFSATGALSSPFAVSSGSVLDINSPRVMKATYSARKTQINDLINATSAADCKTKMVIDFTSINSASKANCYGPQINWSVVSGPNQYPDSNNGVVAGPSNLPGGDVGIWGDLDGSEACTASHVNALTDFAANMPFMAQMVGAYIYCSANNGVTGVSLPGTGSTITVAAADLTGLNITGATSLTLSAVSITGITNSAGDTGFRYDVTGNMATTTPSRNYDFRSVNQYIRSGSGAESGTASYYFKVPTNTMGNCPETDGVHHYKASMIAGRLMFNLNAAGTTVVDELRQASFCGSDASSVLEADFNIDFANRFGDGSISPVNPDGWADNAYYVLYSFNPTTLDGDYIGAWQAGFGDSNTRVFNSHLASSGGTQTGTSYFGFGTTIQTSATLGDISGMICDWLNGSHTPVNYVQKQTISRTSSTSTWTVDAGNSAIAYAPVNACFNTSANFQYSNSAYPTPTYSNDCPAGNCVASVTLYSKASMSTDALFSKPTAPTF